jgi:uncharacterized protein
MHTPGDRPANRLIHETSPYLLQHAYNPVDWYPWGAEALQKAVREQKPILLSVGYSACHWCHVMERESFENSAIAGIMNAGFVCIKVDREERPDIDDIYMNAVQVMTGQGGWPMTVFLTPDGRPFYGGTYFPPEDMYGRPGFPRILQAVAEAWQSQRAEVEAQSDQLLTTLNAGVSTITSQQTHSMLTESELETALNSLSEMFDGRNGGFGTAPKFPQPCVLDFLLRMHHKTGRSTPLEMAELTLQKMALGGIYDQLGGGFHRYSTDGQWLAPHFEKMLYDNAQLAQTYCRAYQITGKQFYRDIAEETLEYALREMTDPETGAFYSAQDADSEGEEGKFFVWSKSELEALLGEGPAAIVASFYDVTEQGNWEGKNILRVVQDVRETAREHGIDVQTAAAIIDGARPKMLAYRAQRVTPGLDDKCLTSWNALMTAAMAECGAAFDRTDFLDAARRSAAFLIDHMSRTTDGERRLLRTCRNGEARLNGYLEDYSFTIDALLKLYDVTLEVRWLTVALELAETMFNRFQDTHDFTFYSTSDDHEQLILRIKDSDDNAIPSGNTVALEVMLRIASLTGDTGMHRQVGMVLRRAVPLMTKHAYSFARLLGVLDWYLAGTTEVVFTAPTPEDAELKQLLHTVNSRYLPNRVSAARFGSAAESGPDLDLLRHLPSDMQATAVCVCRNNTCSLPVTTAAELSALV